MQYNGQTPAKVAEIHIQGRDRLLMLSQATAKARVRTDVRIGHDSSTFCVFQW